MAEINQTSEASALISQVLQLSNELTKLKGQLDYQSPLSSLIDIITGESDVRKLHHKYGYYLDKCLYKEVADLFADHPDTYVQFLNGRFNGKEGVNRLYLGRFANRFVNGRNGPMEGWLLDHLMAQDIIDFDPEAGRAKGRARTLMSAGTHQSLPSDFPGGLRQWWEGGLYENEYILQDGTWKILRLRYYPFWHGTFESGWKNCTNYVPLYKQTFPADVVGPDEILDDVSLWPDTRVIPFHYKHPITGEDVAEPDMRAPKLSDIGDPSTAPPSRAITDWGF